MEKDSVSATCTPKYTVGARLRFLMVCRIILESFAGDIIFQDVLNTAFEYFINLGQHTPEYISLYMDHHLRKGVEGALAKNNLESILEQAFMLFRYISDKDAFKKYYKQHLAKRLLSGKAVSTILTLPSQIPDCNFTLASKEFVALCWRM